MSKTIKSQGTHLFFAVGGAIQKLTCPTGVTGLNSGDTPQIPETCLDDDAEQFVGALFSPGAVTVPFNFHPAAASQRALFDLFTSGDKIPWLAALSDGVGVPTIDGEAMVAPTDRTSLAFNAYISGLTIDLATNDLVRGTLTLQTSGRTVVNWKEEAEADV